MVPYLKHALIIFILDFYLFVLNRYIALFPTSIVNRCFCLAGVVSVGNPLLTNWSAKMKTAFLMLVRSIWEYSLYASVKLSLGIDRKSHIYPVVNAPNLSTGQQSAFPAMICNAPICRLDWHAVCEH